MIHLHVPSPRPWPDAGEVGAGGKADGERRAGLPSALPPLSWQLSLRPHSAVVTQVAGLSGEGRWGGPWRGGC